MDQSGSDNLMATLMATPSDKELQQRIACWRIWFDDGSMISGKTEHEWQAAPRHGVLIVKHNRVIHMGLDYYWFENETVKSCNRMDIDRYLEREQGIRCVKFGRWADHYVWEKVQQDSREPCKDCD